ncbi:hypothetical protein QJS04_geneDACA014617 [Acorus gramineus]|uniref:Uncharacterized protein n=1 Tax=Acorus gramineus TaxID=55184 RepID=A0AAV9ARM0_ACOGR|nr:hypothetical protein QJS04_geneDACA014617 [Acorus gramineus]
MRAGGSSRVLVPISIDGRRFDTWWSVRIAWLLGGRSAVREASAAMRACGGVRVCEIILESWGCVRASARGCAWAAGPCDGRDEACVTMCMHVHAPCPNCSLPCISACIPRLTFASLALIG